MTFRILITGINGYIAMHTAAKLLGAGYTVRGTLRRKSPDLVATLQKALAPYRRPDDPPDTLEFVEVPDIGAPNAFDDVISDVDGIAHLASPVSMTMDKQMLHTAVLGTTRLMDSAMNASTRGSPLRSVLFMSSISAVFSPQRSPGSRIDWADWNEAAEPEVQLLYATNRSAPGYLVYQASKVQAERAFWSYQQKNPPFDMVSLCPAPVLGPPLYLPDPISNLSMRVKDIYDVLGGGAIPEFSPIRGTFVDVRDVADMVLRTMEMRPDAAKVKDLEDPVLQKVKRYLLIGESRRFRVSPQAMAHVLRQDFEDGDKMVQRGNPSEDFHVPWQFCTERASNVRKEPWIPFEKSVVDSARAIRDLVKASSNPKWPPQGVKLGGP